MVELDHERLLATFAEESGELLTEMAELLVTLETHPDEERLRSIFRGAHTMKGGAAALGFSSMAEVAHVLEDVLVALLERRLPVSDEHVMLMLEAVDQLREMKGLALAGREWPPERSAELLKRLRARGESLWR